MEQSHAPYLHCFSQSHSLKVSQSHSQSFPLHPAPCTLNPRHMMPIHIRTDIFNAQIHSSQDKEYSNNDDDDRDDLSNLIPELYAHDFPQ